MLYKLYVATAMYDSILTESHGLERMINWGTTPGPPPCASKIFQGTRRYIAPGTPQFTKAWTRLKPPGFLGNSGTLLLYTK